MTALSADESLVEMLLAEQRSLAAVDRFAQTHRDVETPLLAPLYEDLIPLGRSPMEGEQLAFRVDLDACTGCKACVTACHNLNGLAEDEAWRDVGLLFADGANGTHPQTVTTACHHCEDPACMSGCPTQAYEKDPKTGIVRHLDDQCIGCQYCLLTCPYDAPRFDATRGIVRKCDMCTDRLRDGEAPACAQGCPTTAISIEIVKTGVSPSVPLPLLGEQQPDPALTRPTTNYVTHRPGTTAFATAATIARPKHGHPALSVLLVLVQLSTGVLLLDLTASLLAAPSPSERLALLLVSSGALAAGMVASVSHLGRPSQMFRAVLGWRTSWMTREILALGGYAALLGATLASSLLGHPSTFLAWAALSVGLAASTCSVQVYATTGRAWWAGRRTGGAFASTTVVLGAAALVLIGLVAGDASAIRIAAGTTVALVAGVSTVQRWRRFTAGCEGVPDIALDRSRALLRGPLLRTTRIREACICAGLVFLTVAGMLSSVAEPGADAACAAVAFAALFIGALVDRSLFFTAEAAPGMPGL